MNKKDTILLSWDRYQKMAEYLALEIKKDFVPCVIVGIVRGGLILTVQLSHLLGVRNIDWIVARRTKSDKIGDFGEGVEIIGSGALDVKDKNVLLVDDIGDTGATINTALDVLKKKRPKDIKVASLFLKYHCKAKVDYYCERVKNNKWIIFPWENQSIK